MLLDLYRHAAHYRRLKKDRQAQKENPNNRGIESKQDNGMELG